MSLRPRYSLLTLLLLTTAVAVGIKLWRGPHRAVMSNPPTPAEQIILDRTSMTAVHAEYFKPLRYEYDFVRTWDGPDFSTVVGRPSGAAPIQVLPTGVTLKYQLVPPQLSGITLSPPNNPALNNPAFERLICWVHSGNEKPSPFASTLTSSSGHVTVSKHLTYYVSSRKRLYVDSWALFVESQVLQSGIYVQQIELADVPDPAVRARIAEGLASIPDSQ